MPLVGTNIEVGTVNTAGKPTRGAYRAGLRRKRAHEAFMVADGDPEMTELRAWHAELCGDYGNPCKRWLDDFHLFEAAVKDYGHRHLMDSAAMNFVISLPWLKKTSEAGERLIALIAQMKVLDSGNTASSGPPKLRVERW